MPGKQRGRDKVEKLRRALFRRDWEKADTVIRQLPQGRLLPNLYVDQEKWSVLHVAAMVNVPVSLLEKILNVVDVNFGSEKDANGNSPLHKAARSNASIEIVRLLARACPKSFHEENTEEKKSPFDIILQERRFESQEIAELVRDVASVWPEGMYSTNAREENLLHRAVPYCIDFGIDVAEAIVEAAPELLERTDETRSTPLHVAVRRNGRYAEALIEFLAGREGTGPLDLEDCRGRMPLHEACAIGADQNVIELLVQKYPDALDVADDAGKTPLILFGHRHRRHYVPSRNDKVTIAEVAMTLLTRAPVRCSDSPSLLSLLRNDQCKPIVARFIVTALPDQASVVDENGDLPLHFVSSLPDVRGIYYSHVVHALLEAYPAACKISNRNGALPLQLMVQSGKTWSDGMGLVVCEHPAGVMYLGLNSYAMCEVLCRLGGESPPDVLFRLLKNAPHLLQT